MASHAAPGSRPVGSFVRNSSTPVNFKPSSRKQGEEKLEQRQPLDTEHECGAEENQQEQVANNAILMEEQRTKSANKTEKMDGVVAKDFDRRLDCEDSRSERDDTSSEQEDSSGRNSIIIGTKETTLSKPNSSSSSSSLRASDSAFSHSQSTLQSDEDGVQSGGSSFRVAISQLTKETSMRMRLESPKAKKHSQHQQQEQKQQINSFICEAQNNTRPPPPAHATKQVRADGFKMIWRNLNFQVPEKRFSQLNASWKRHKEFIWSKSMSREQDSIQCDSPKNNDNSTIKDASSTSSSSSSSSVRSNLSYAPTATSARKLIFENLHGCAESGKLTAILGPSGAGKTTLLNCLTNSIVKGVSGSITICDYDYNSNKNNPNDITTTSSSTKRTTRKRLKLCIIPQKG